MPFATVPNNKQEIVKSGLDLVRRIMAARRGGFFISERMLADLIANEYGIVLPPEMASSIYYAVTSTVCQHELPLPDWSREEACGVAHEFTPSGVVAVQTFPALAMRFSDVTDIVCYRLLLPAR